MTATIKAVQFLILCPFCRITLPLRFGWVDLRMMLYELQLKTKDAVMRNTSSALILMLGAISTFHANGANDDSLSAAFLDQCKKMQSCALEEIKSRDLDPSMVTMMEARMQGQCEAQVARISQIEEQAHTGPHAEKADQMKACFRARAALACDILASEPVIPECDDI